VSNIPSDILNSMFKDFGPVYVINLKRREDRRYLLENIFKEKQITDYTFIDAVDYNEDISSLVHCYPSKNITKQEMSVMMSHLKSIKFWLENSDSEYAIILEDDIDFNLSQYWGFTWKDFINYLNIDYDVLQLSAHYVDYNHELKIHKKIYTEYSAAFYIIKREYAKTLIKKYFIENKYNFKYTDPEHIADYYGIFKKEKCYTIPLLVPNPSLGTDNASFPEGDEIFQTEEWIKEQRIKMFYLNESIVTKLWQNNSLTLEELLKID
jgi:GR25 family glycosyltransferase involved in LPS biosynthesis